MLTQSNAMSPLMPMPRTARVYIAGHQGLVGSALYRHFANLGFVNLLVQSSSEIDLRDAGATAEFLAESRPDVVINAAATVGGIAANADRPADFLSDNLRIQLNLLDASVACGVGRFLFLGSSCIYPKVTAQPIREEALLTGQLEETNKGFAMAKLAGIAHVSAIRRQHGLPYICAMPTSLYGPGDNFSLEDGHVLPSMIRRFHEATRDDVSSVTCWGSGKPRREFLYVADFAEACHVLLDEYDAELPINVGVGEDVTIADLASLVAEVVGYRGEIHWDATRPDGTFQKLLDTRRLTEFQWKPKTSLTEGVRATYEWFLQNQHDYRR